VPQEVLENIRSDLTPQFKETGRLYNELETLENDS